MSVLACRGTAVRFPTAEHVLVLLRSFQTASGAYPASNRARTGGSLAEVRRQVREALRLSQFRKECLKTSSTCCLFALLSQPGCKRPLILFTQSEV